GTEMTHAIEEDNCVVVLHASAPPPSPPAALAGRCETSYPTAGSLCRAFLRLPTGRVAILMVEHAHQHCERPRNPARASAHDTLSGCWAGRFLNQSVNLYHPLQPGLPLV